MTQFLLFLYTIGALNAVYACVVVSLLIIVLRQLLQTRQVYLNALVHPSFWVLFIFGISYALIGGATLRMMLYYWATPVLAYLCGWCYLDRQKMPAEENIKKIILPMLLGFGVHALLNFVINIDNDRLVLEDIFSGELRSATGSGSMNTMIFSLLIYFALIEKRKHIKIVGLLLFVISLLYAFVLGSRTQFIIMAIVAAIIFVCYTYEVRRKAFRRILLTVIGVCAVIAALYYGDVFGIREFVESSNLLHRIEEGTDTVASNEVRFEAVGRGLRSLFEHPFGGQERVFYFHNMWLDIGRIAGIIPTLLMVCYSVMTFVHAIAIFRNKKNDIYVRYILLSLYIGVFLNFMTEPILEGILDFFYTFCIINGMTECYYYRCGGKNCKFKSDQRYTTVLQKGNYQF